MPGLELWTTALLLDISIKAALLATAAWIGMALFRVRSSHLQHRVWLLVLAGMLLLPALVHLAPSISLPHWLYPDLQLTAANVEPDPVIAIPLVLGLPIEPQQINPVPSEMPSFEPTPTPEVTLSVPPLLVGTDPTGTAPAPVAVPEAVVPLSIPLAVVLPETQAETQAETRPNSAALVVLAIYLIGLAIQTTRLVIGMAWTLRLSHHARPIETPLAITWLPHWAALAESTELRVPVTVGYWRPVVMLPADWTTWSEEFLSMVLAHEAEHVRRRDTWAALLAALNTALFWFHPAAWLVRRRLTDLAEQICDDEVIRITGSRGDYAQNLLEMAGRLTSDPRRLAPVGVAMARKANVVKRIEAIIDRDRPLSRRIGTLAALLLLTAVVPLVFLAAGLRATDPSEAAEADPIAETDTDPSATTAAIQRNGRKFVYVLDRSLSMDGAEHSPLEAAQAELIASLDSLEETHQFQIVFYNETPRVFNPARLQGKLALGTEQNKLRARRFVESITPLGRAEHESALKLAIRTQPDVIFFLTAASDSQLSDRQLYEIQRQAAGIQINTIEIGSGPKQGGDSFLNKLARQNGGQYAYRDITKSAGDAVESESSATSLKGRVALASDGEMVAGAEVRLRCESPRGGFRTLKTCRTNEAGVFEFTKLDEGRYHVAGFYQNLTSRTKGRKRGEKVDLGDSSIFLELHEAPSLHVTVVSREDGEPIPKALVHLGLPINRDQEDYYCDENGEVLIQGATPESWQVWARAKGFVLQQDAVHLTGTGSVRMTIGLEVGTELVGTVRDDSGKAMIGQSISVFRPGSYIPLDSVKTDAEGKYRFEDVPLAEANLTVWGNDIVNDRFKAKPSKQQEFDLTLRRRPYGGAVRGVVQDWNGTPVSGATIENDGPRGRSAVTGEDGTFQIDDVLSSGSLGYRLVVKAKGLAPREIAFRPGTKEKPAELEITLEPGHAIHGKVVDASGTAIAGAQVVAVPAGSDRHGNMKDTRRTDAEGRFEFDSLPAGVRFEFNKVGYATTDDMSHPDDMREELVITMLSAGIILGQVVDDRTGKPVSPFTARLDSTPDGWPGERFASPDATFRFENLTHRAPRQVTVEADGYDRKVVPSVAAAPDEEAEPVQVRLTPVDPELSVGNIAGRVVLASDESPVAGAVVRLLIAKKNMIPEREQTTTNEQGEFEFNQLVEGQKILLAFHENLASRTKMFQGHMAKDGDHDILLKLREVPSLKVKVVTRAESKPIEDATVRLSWTDTKQEYRTDANGEALIQGLTSEMWRIESRAKDFAVDARRVQLSRTGVSSVTVELDPGAELYGVVRDENGAPLPRASVSVHRNEQSNYSITDSEGKYRVEHLPIAGLSVSGLKEGYFTARSDVTITVPPGGEQELNLTLTRRPDGGSVQGVVVDSEGNPVEAVSVSNPGPVVPRDARETTTDARGHYRLDNVFEANGTHTLRVAAKGFATQRFPFAPGTRENPAQVNVTLEAGHRIRGRVIDEQGQPLTSVQAKWHDPSLSGFPWRNSVTTDREGRFELDSLPTYPTFQFRKDGYSEIRQARLSLDGDDEVVVTMQSEGVIRGRVVDAETGNAVSPFTIRVDSTLDRKPGDVSGGLNEDRMAGIEMVPDEDGTFSMANFVRGSFWRLTVEADGYDPLFVPRIGVATESDVETVEFRLTPFDDSQLLTLAGQLENEQGLPITGVEFRLIVATDRPDPPRARDARPFDWVSIRYDDGPRNGEAVLQFLKATTDGEGRFTFDRVRPADDLELVYWGTGASKQRIIFKRTRTDDDGAPRYERIAKDGTEQSTQYSAEALQGLTIKTKTPGIIRGSIDRAALPDLRVIRLTAANGDSQGTTISPSKDSYEIHNVAPGMYTLHVDELRPRQPQPMYAGQPGNALDGGPVEKGIPVEVKPGETVTVDLDSESPVHLKPKVPPPSATYYGYTNGPMPPSYAPEPASQSKQPLPTPWNGATTAPPYPDAANKASSQDPSTSIPAIFTGRRAPRKASLLQLNGGNARTTEAVNAGLQWLAQNQQEDGSWSLTGPYADGARQENREAATAMALLAFQGDGNTTDHGEHQSVVKRGWQYLLNQQDSDGCFFRNGSFGHRFYTHGQATIAICELFAMTEDSELRQSYKEPAEKAIAYCVKSQSPLGGWKYAPQASADLSVTGWILVALQTARIAGLDVPDETLAGITKYLDQIAQHGGSRYPYEKGREVTRTMTAEGLLCRQYLGWRPTQPELREGVDWLLRPENQISYTDERDVYYWYYATQVMYHMGGDPWQKWNRVMGQELPAQQSRHEAEAGSWDPAKPSQDEWGGEGGRLFVTCLSIYMLEAYYRHSPIYAGATRAASSSGPELKKSSNDEPTIALTEQPTLRAVTGRIVNEQSQPIADVHLRLMVVKNTGRPRYAITLPSIITPQTIRSGEAKSSEHVQQFMATTTDREGRFRFDGVRTDNRIKLAYWGSNVVGRYWTLAQEDLNDLTIRTRTPATVRVTIDRDAFPAVDFYPSTGPAGFIEAPQRAQDNSYEIRELPPGHFGTLLTYRRPDDEPNAQSGRVEIRMALSAGENVAIRIGAPWDFVVMDKAGTPLRDATVVYLCDRPYSLLPRKHAQKVTDKNGHAQLAVIEHNGPIGHVHVTAEGYGTQRLPVRQSGSTPATQTIQLRPVGRLEGRILSDDKTLIASATGYISQPGQGENVTSGFATIEVGEDGRFVVPEFAEGTARFVISTDQAPPLRPRLPESIEIRSGETTKVEIPLERTVYVRGILQTKDDATPVADAKILVYYNDLQGVSSARSDAQGRFAMNVLAGEVRQVFWRPRREFSRWTKVPKTAPIVIQEGAVTFDLPPIEVAERPGPVGRLIDQAIRPVSNARVTIVSEGHTIRSELSDEDGAFVLQLPEALPDFNINRIEKIQVSLPDQEAPLPATMLEGSMPFVLQIDE